MDLSGEFDDGGGSFGMFARLAQVVYTVTRSADIDEVVFSVDGEVVTVFSAEGIGSTEPSNEMTTTTCCLRFSSIPLPGVSR